MISLRLGNVGSGKSACAVREMILNESHRKTYSNIRVKSKNCVLLKKEMIVVRDVLGAKKSGEEIVSLKVNVDFWKQMTEPINVVIDEAHAIGLNARRSMSRTNQILLEWLSLIRRVLGQNESGAGTLVLITQLPNRIDTIARDMATNVRWHKCHYTKSCTACRYSWAEDSECPEPQWICPMCSGYKLRKHSHRIEVWHFASMQLFEAWKTFGMDTAHRHYMVNDIERYFPAYDTLSWDNFFSDS